MIYYHVNIDLSWTNSYIDINGKPNLFNIIYNKYKIKEFKPRIPINIMKNENNTIKRICVTDSILNSLKAMPYFIYKVIKKPNSDLDDPYELIELIITVLPQNITGVIAEVYEFDTNDFTKDDIVSNKELITKKLVPDAKETGEAWVLKNVKTEKLKKYRVLIYDWDDELNYAKILKINDDQLDNLKFVMGYE